MMGRRGGQGRQQKIVPKSKDTKKAFLRLIKYIRPYMGLLSIAIVFAIVGTFFDIFGPYVMGLTTTYVFNGISTGTGVENSVFMQYVFILIGIYVIASTAEYIRGKIVVNINSKIIYSMREELSNKLKFLPISYFDKHQVGDLLSRMTNDIQTIADSLSQIINQLLSSVVSVLGILGIMLYLNPTLTLITLIVIPLNLYLSFKIAGLAQKQFSIQYHELGDLNAHIEEMFSSNKVVKANNYKTRAIEEFDVTNKKLRESAAKANFLSGILMPITIFVNNIGLILVTIAGAVFMANGMITIGSLQSFIQYSRKFGNPIANLTEVMNIIQSGISAAERVFEVLDAENEIQDTVDSLGTENLEPRVSIENASFGYDKEQMIIKHLNLEVKEGSQIAIVGPTGAGKTTLVNLLMRFYDVDEGSIKLDGVDVKNIRRGDLRDYFGMVLQDTWLFEGTIAENIAYGSENVSREEIIAAAKNSYSHDFIMAMPNGYNSMLTENASNISEGQKQLLTIARALIANPKILILDEATSSVDTRTERLIQKAMGKLVKGRTSFIIAHRLSTIVNADRILVLRDGDIVEQGTHRELLNLNGFYKELYDSQF